MNALMLSCASGNLDVVKLIYKATFKTQNEKLTENNVPFSNLMIAASCGNEEIIQFLLDKGASANEQCTKTGMIH